MRSQRTDTRINTASRTTAAGATRASGQRTTELGRPIASDGYSRTRGVLMALGITTVLSGAALVGALATGIITVDRDVTITGTINCSSTTAQIESAVRDLKRQLGDNGLASRAEEAATAVRDEFRKRCS